MSVRGPIDISYTMAHCDQPFSRHLLVATRTLPLEMAVETNISGGSRSNHGIPAKSTGRRNTVPFRSIRQAA